MDAVANRQELLGLTTEIVAAYAGSNAIAVSELPALIASVFSSLSTASQPIPEKVAGTPMPAVPIKKSVSDAYIVCLEDGKKLKILKRHLASRYNMTPEDYRRRWGLPADYPMVAPSYAAQRSSLARKIGLGRKPAAAHAAPPPPPAMSAPAGPPRRVGGRKKTS